MDENSGGLFRLGRPSFETRRSESRGMTKVYRYSCAIYTVDLMSKSRISSMPVLSIIRYDKGSNVDIWYTESYVKNFGGKFDERSTIPH